MSEEIKAPVYEQGYPIWRYHQDKKPEGLIVYSSAEDKALGDGWVDSPAQFLNGKEPICPVVEMVHPNESENEQVIPLKKKGRKH